MQKETMVRAYSEVNRPEDAMKWLKRAGVGGA